jgi:antitoxin VapB
MSHLYILFQFVYNAVMPLSIRNPEVERLARALSRLTGEGLTQTILQALRERHQRIRAARQQERLVEDLTVIARRAASLPRRDRRSPEEIIGYDENGLPK